VNQRRTTRAITKAVMITIGAIGIFWAADAWAAGNAKEVQDLKREVSQLRAELQALQSALAETTDMERQRDANLIRAMKQEVLAPQASASPPAPSPPAEEAADGSEAAGASAAREAAASPARVAAAEEKGRTARNHRRHKRAARAHSKASRVLTDEK
jgi:hypothetical protein